MITVDRDRPKLVMQFPVAQGTSPAPVGTKLFTDPEWVCERSSDATDCVGGEEVYSREMTPAERFMHIVAMTGLSWHERPCAPMRAQGEIAFWKWYGVFAVYLEQEEKLLIAASEAAVRWFHERI